MKKLLFLVTMFVMCEIVSHAQTRTPILSAIDTKVINNPSAPLRAADLNAILKSITNFQDSLSFDGRYVKMSAAQTITGQKIFTQPVVIVNGLIGGTGGSTNILHRENLINSSTASNVGIAFGPNNVTTLPNTNKVVVFLKDTFNVTSDTAEWRGMNMLFINTGSKMGRVFGYYYNATGIWSGQEIPFGNKRGTNTFNDSIGKTGIGLPYVSIAAKLHVRNTHNSGDAFLLEDSTGANTLLEADSTNRIGIGGKSSGVVGVRIGRTVAIDSLAAASSSDSLVTVKNGILGRAVSPNSTLSTFLPYVQTATYATMLTHISANATMALPNGTTTAYRKYLVINDYEADGTGDGASSEYLYAKDKDGNPLLQKIARYTP